MSERQGPSSEQQPPGRSLAKTKQVGGFLPESVLTQPLLSGQIAGGKFFPDLTALQSTIGNRAVTRMLAQRRAEAKMGTADRLPAEDADRAVRRLQTPTQPRADAVIAQGRALGRLRDPGAQDGGRQPLSSAAPGRFRTYARGLRRQLVPTRRRSTPWAAPNRRRAPALAERTRYLTERESSSVGPVRRCSVTQSWSRDRQVRSSRTG